MALQVGLGLVALAVLKLEASRPRYKKEVKGAYSVPESAAPGAPFRRADKLGELTTTPFPGCDTIYSTFQYAARNNGSRNAVGTRKVLKVRSCAHDSGAAFVAFPAPPRCWPPLAAASCVARRSCSQRRVRGGCAALCGAPVATVPKTQNDRLGTLGCLAARRGGIAAIAAPQPQTMRQLHVPRRLCSAPPRRATHAVRAGGARF